MDTLEENYHELRVSKLGESFSLEVYKMFPSQNKYKELLEQRLAVRELEDLCKSKVTKLQDRVQLIQATAQ